MKNRKTGFWFAWMLAMGGNAVFAQAPGTATGVFIRDSTTAMERMELARKMERLKEWNNASDLYQEVMEKFSDRVVPSFYDEKRKPVTYQSIRHAVIAAIAKWPDEGIAAYNAKYESAASRLLEEAAPDDLIALHKAFDNYFITPSGKAAGIRLVNLSMENGQFAGAQQIASQLLEFHPSLGEDEAPLLLRATAAANLLGMDRAAEKYSLDIQRRFPQFVFTIGGSKVPVQEALAMTHMKATRGKGVLEGYPTIGGDDTRGLLSNASSLPTARVLALKLQPVSGPALSLGGSASAAEKFRMIGASIIPAIDHGQLFYQDGQRITALQLESGTPLAGWLQTYPSRNGQFQNSAGNVVKGAANTSITLRPIRQHTLAVTEGQVLAVMSEVESASTSSHYIGNASYIIQTVKERTTLVCLDRTTGARLWERRPDSIPGNAGNAKNVQFSGSPLVVGERVYIAAHGSSAGRSHDCSVICFDLKSGNYLWASYIASNQTSVSESSGSNVPDFNCFNTHLAHESGRIYVCSDIGAIAAIDAYNGATAWLRLYDSTEGTALNMGLLLAFNNGERALDVLPRPWMYSPPIVSQGKLFVLPIDGKQILILDAATGDIVNSLTSSLQASANGESYDFKSLVGVKENMLAIASAKSIFLIDWMKAKTVGNTNRLVSDSVFRPYTTDSIAGRPFLTQSLLYIPTENYLDIIDLSTMKLSTSRMQISSPEPEGGVERLAPGNVVATGNMVVIANSWNIGIFSDMTSAKRRFEEALAKNASDIEARLIYAESAFTSRSHKLALSMLDEAAGLIGPGDSTHPLKTRLFSDAMLFANMMGNTKPGAGSSADPQSSLDAEGIKAMTDAFYDRASKYASNASQQVQYRVQRAKYSAKMNFPEKAADLYQEILLDNDLKIAPAPSDDNTSGKQAGEYAEAALDSLIQSTKGDAYRNIQRTADDLLKKLGVDANPADLFRLAEQYPNSESARDAMTQAAKIFEQQNDFRQATQALRQYYWKYYSKLEDPKKVELLVSLARNSLRTGNVSVAYARLQRSQTLAGTAQYKISPLLDPEGNVLSDKNKQPATTLGQALVALDLIQGNAEELLPDSGIPKKTSSDNAIQPFKPRKDLVAQASGILAPDGEISGKARYDLAMIVKDGALGAYAPGQPKPLWTHAPADPPRRVIAVARKRSLAIGSNTMALLDNADGNVFWTFDLKSAPTLDPMSGPAIPPDSEKAGRSGGAWGGDIPEDGLREGFVVQDPQLTAKKNLSVSAGINDGNEHLSLSRTTDDRAILVTNRGRVMAISLTDGKVLWQTRVANADMVKRIETNSDFTAIMLAGEENASMLRVLDTQTGRNVWQSAFYASNPLVNFILADDGTLVWTTPNAIFGKDLYEPGSREWKNASKQFANMIYPQQMVIYKQQVVALCNNGAGFAKLLLSNGTDGPNPIASRGNAGTGGMLTLIGSNLYCIGNNMAAVYYLDTGASNPPYSLPSASTTGSRTATLFPASAVFTKQYLIIPVMAASNKLQLFCYSREKTAQGKESGSLVYTFDTGFQGNNLTNNFSIHAVDGGVLCYSSGNAVWFEGNGTGK